MTDWTTEAKGTGRRDGGWLGEGRPVGGSALAILPGLTHYNIFASPILAAARPSLPRPAERCAVT